MKFRLLPCLFFFLAYTNASAAPQLDLLSQDDYPPVSGLRVANNYPFPVREKIIFRLAPDLAADKDNLLAISHSVVGGTVEAHYLPVQLVPTADGENTLAWLDVQLRPDESRRYTFQSLGGAGKKAAQPEITETAPNGLPQAISLPSGTSTALFQLSFPSRALRETAADKFQLVDESHGPVLSTYLYRGNFSGETEGQAEIRYDLLSSGVCEITLSLKSASSEKLAGKVLLTPAISSSDDSLYIRQKGEIKTITASTSYPIQGISWLAFPAEENGIAGALLVEPNSTLQNPTSSSLIQSDDNWILVSQLDTDSTSQEFHFRVLPAGKQEADAVDQAYHAFVGYQGRAIVEEDQQVEFGVGAVGFGATFSYNKNWSTAQAQIERDLRIASAMGLEWIQIDGIDSPKKSDFVKFMATAAKEVGLKSLLNLSASISPKDAGQFAKKFGDLISHYEVEPASSRSTNKQSTTLQKIRDAILAAQPDASGLGTDSVAESFSASVTSPTETSQLAEAVLALGHYASLHGKHPLITAYPGSGDSKQSDEEQAQQYYRNHQNLLDVRGAELIFLSGFSAAPAKENDPAALLRPDGSAKPQAQALHELIKRYTSDQQPNKQIEVKMTLLRISPDRTVTLPVVITNKSNQPREIRSELILPVGFSTDSAEETFTLRPRQSRTVEYTINTEKDLAPGLHHIFVKAETENITRLGWTYARYRVSE